MHIKAIGSDIIQFPYRMDDLKKSNPNTSFPRGYDTNEALLASFGVYLVVDADRPAFDENTHVLGRSSEPVLVDGVWTWGWDIIPLSEEAMLASRKTEEDFLRGERNRFLRESDWRALTDHPVSAEWAAYRQDLRDITDQPGWPDDVVWPVEPGTI